MRNDNKPEMQHVVPKEALLKNFAFKKKGKKSYHVHLFDRVEGKTIPTQPSVNNVLGQRNFYSVQLGESVYTAEGALTSLEDLASPIIKKIVSSGSLASISDSDRAKLSKFVAVQWLRAPKIRDSQFTLWKTVAEKCKRLAPDAANLEEVEAYTSDAAIKYRSIRLLEDATRELAKLVYSYNWLLFRATKTRSFWISDCPVVMHTHEDFGPYGNLGFGVPGVQITLPLSSELALSIWHPKIVRDKHRELAEGLKAIQRYRAVNTLSPNSRLKALDREVSELETNLEGVRGLLDGLDKGDAIQTSEDNMEHYNSLQFDWSRRFIVSKKDDFHLAQKMFAEEPGRGVRFTID